MAIVQKEIAQAIYAELSRQYDEGGSGAPYADALNDDLTDVVVDGHADLMALAKVAIDAVQRADRTALFIEIDELTDKISTALQQAPYVIAAPAIRHLEAITAAVADPLGDHFGTCILCEEPIFVRGQPDDDCESAGDEYAHRTCGDRWRKENPGERTHVDTEEDE